MPAAPLPVFVRLPGDIVGAIPYRATGCLTQVMFLKGDRRAQQAFCDLTINRPSNGALAFHVVTDMVLVTAIYADAMGSTDPVDASKGVMQEWDVGFWTAVHGGRVGEEDDWKTYWLPSYLFVDTAYAMAAGREIYGYPKTAGTFSDHTGQVADPSVTITVLHFPVFGPGRRPANEPLVRIKRGGAGVPAPGLAENLKAAWDLIGQLADPLPPLFHDGFHLPPMPSLSVPQIMLRQTRDPVTLGRATVQEILFVAPRPLKVRGVGLLHSPAVVEFIPSTSHPIMETLGLASSQTGELGFWIEHDFEVGAAQRLF